MIAGDPARLGDVLPTIHGKTLPVGDYVMIINSSRGYGLNVASPDPDNDGLAEIIVGLGPSSKNPSTVKVYKTDEHY
jgi:hypothetical protein